MHAMNSKRSLRASNVAHCAHLKPSHPSLIMIYLILTASLLNRFGPNEEREARYHMALTETLSHLPTSIRPVLVENNGTRKTMLDHYVHDGKSVPVVYTETNRNPPSDKGMNEFIDLKEVIRVIGIQETDIIIKLTGRYRMMDASFFIQVIHEADRYDAWMKFYGTCSLRFEPYDCVLGCYAIRALYLSWFPLPMIRLYPSAEVAFATYVRRSLPRIQEIQTLGVECCFGEDGRILHV